MAAGSSSTADDPGHVGPVTIFVVASSYRKKDRLSSGEVHSHLDPLFSHQVLVACDARIEEGNRDSLAIGTRQIGTHDAAQDVQLQAVDVARRAGIGGGSNGSIHGDIAHGRGFQQLADLTFVQARSLALDPA